jgi:hypothetical protein
MEFGYQSRGDAWIRKAEELYKIQKIRREVEREEAELLSQLKELSGNESSRGGSFKFTATERKGSIDYKAIPELRMINLELYRKESVITWKLELDMVIQ